MNRVAQSTNSIVVVARWCCCCCCCFIRPIDLCLIDCHRNVNDSIPKIRHLDSRTHLHAYRLFIFFLPGSFSPLHSSLSNEFVFTSWRLLGGHKEEFFLFQKTGPLNVVKENTNIFGQFLFRVEVVETRRSTDIDAHPQSSLNSFEEGPLLISSQSGVQSN